MNFTAIAKEMHKKDGKSVKQLVLKNLDNKELQQYLIYDKGKLKGVQEEGLEILRKLGHQYTPKETTAKTTVSDIEVLELKHKVELLEVKLDSQERLVQELQRDKERLLNENEQLKAELNEYRKAGLFKRLIGFKG